MLYLPTTLLRHTARHGCHYDWLLADPRAFTAPDRPDRCLWTARVAIPTRFWRDAGAWRLTPLPPHRKRYLAYQGPLGHGRGSVRTADRGWFVPLLWTDSRMVLALSMRGFQGRVELRRLSPTLYRAVATQPIAV